MHLYKLVPFTLSGATTGTQSTGGAADTSASPPADDVDAVLSAMFPKLAKKQGLMEGEEK
jgi:hypothetical protein